MDQVDEGANIELLELPRGPAVAVHHRHRLVGRAVADPRVVLPLSEGDRHERRPQVVCAHLSGVLRGLEELGAGHARELQGVAQTRRDPHLRLLVGGHVDERALLRLAMALLPNAHRARDVGPDRPHARVVRLRLRRGEGALVEVPLRPLGVDELGDAHTLAIEDAEEEAVGLRHLCARKELRLLAREDARVVPL